MGSADASARDLLRQDVYFADVFNYLVYDGDEVVRPEGLRELDTASLVMPFGDGARYAVQRYRDVLKSWGAMSDGNAAYLLLGIEEQTKVHYGMPVRCALYDAISYADQIAKSKRSYSDRRKEGAVSVRGRKRRRKGDRKTASSRGKPRYTLTSEEFLSGLRKGDRLLPIVTVVVYLGQEKWDAARSLHELLVLDDPRMASFVPDYRLNLVAPSEMGDEDFAKFNTDLGFAMEVLAKRGSGADKAVTDTNHRKIERPIALFLNEVAGLGLEYVEETGGIDMCLAMEKRIAAERRDAVEQERSAMEQQMAQERSAMEQERRDAEKRGIEATIKMGRLGGMDDAFIADAVAREYGVDRALVEGLMASLSE